MNWKLKTLFRIRFELTTMEAVKQKRIRNDDNLGKKKRKCGRALTLHQIHKLATSHYGIALPIGLKTLTLVGIFNIKQGHFYVTFINLAHSRLLLIFIHSRYIKFAEAWIRTANHWCGKRPLYQLSHNHCLFCSIFTLSH